MQARTLGRIDSMLRLHAESNTPSYRHLSPRVRAMVRKDSQTVSSPGVGLEAADGHHNHASRTNTPGHGHWKEAAIIIGDDDDDLNENGVPDRYYGDDGESRPPKRARKNGSHSFRRGFLGCPICGSEQNHAAKSCSVVQRGPESIKE